MKKFICFIFIIIVIVFSYNYFLNRAKSYTVEYKIEDFIVIEKYDKDNKLYSFNIGDSKVAFDFAYYSDYSNERKVVKKLDVKENDEYICLRPLIEGEEFSYICNDGEYKTSYLVGFEDNKEVKKVKTFNNIEVFSKDYNYFVWNGYGITDVLKEKDYNFLSKENYDNNLAFKADNYILFADYDQKHTFNKLYIFDVEKKEIREWLLKVNIDFDSYFMGQVQDYIYMFDRKNMKQYKLDVKNEKITVSSDSNGALYFDGKWGTKTLKELKYSDYIMSDDNIYDFLLKDDKLIMNINNKLDVLVSDKVDLTLINMSKDFVYYIIEDDIYIFEIGVGERKVLSYFEWNFSYENKIYIFN